MLLSKNVRLTSPILAARPPLKAEEPRTFDRLKNEDNDLIRIQADLPRWQWAFLEARDALELTDVSTAAIIPAVYYEVKRIRNYPRKFKRGGKDAIENFEAISSGTIIEWKFTLSKNLPPHAEDHGRFTRAPEEEEFDRMLSHIGEHLGMSEWGQDYLYGRFVLHPYRDAVKGE